jgi:hypothetical protein
MDLEDNDSVTSFTDCSGNGRDFAASGNPTYQTNVQNGKPAVELDGTGDYFTSEDSFKLRTVFIVCRHDSSTFPSYDGLICRSDSSPTLCGSSGGTSFYTGEGVTNVWVNKTDTDSFAVLGVIKIVCVQWNADYTNLWSVGIDRGMSGREWDGPILRVIGYDTILSSTDRNAVFDALADEYLAGVTTTTTTSSSTTTSSTISTTTTTAPGDTFTPELAKGMVFWMEADDLDLNDADPVGSWAAKNGYTFSQATASSKPTFHANELNGHAAVAFDGGDYMVASAAKGLRSFFVVCDTARSSFTNYDGLLGPTGGSAGAIANGGTTQWYHEMVSNEYRNKVDENVITMNGVPTVYYFELGSAQNLIWEIGKDREYNCWYGRIFEIIGYDRNLPSSNREAVFDYLMDKYLIGVTTTTSSTTTSSSTSSTTSSSSTTTTTTAVPSEYSKGSDILPHDLTSNTSHSPFVVSSLNRYSGCPEYNALGGDGNYFLLEQAGGGQGWWQVYIGSTAKNVYSYAIGVYSELSRAPNTWTFQGSNDGVEWTTLDSRSGIVWASQETKEFTLSDPSGAYKYYRIDITENNGDGTYTRMDEIYMYEATS